MDLKAKNTSAIAMNCEPPYPTTAGNESWVSVAPPISRPHSVGR
jgi:hypothetical protein